LLEDPLLAFDFDGTLAPIVDHPPDARVAKAVSECLAQLACLCPVAVITGRTVRDVEHRLGFSPQFIVGNHGAQMTGEPFVESEALNEARERLIRRADELAAAGVSLEDKGLSIALHYRHAGDRLEAARRIDEMLRGVGPGVHHFGGKHVVNLVPAGAPDKADALFSIVDKTGCTSVVFVGDDVNDEPVYQRAAPHWVTVRVGRDDHGTRARYFLDGQNEIAPMLRAMLAMLLRRG